MFGSTPAGQKACVHVHGVFTYFFIAFDELNEGRIQAEDVCVVKNILPRSVANRFVHYFLNFLDRWMHISLVCKEV